MLKQDKIAGLHIKGENVSFDIFTQGPDDFEIQTNGVHINFPADAVELSMLATDGDDLDAIISVKLGQGHQVRFIAYMSASNAQLINKTFPNITLKK